MHEEFLQQLYEEARPRHTVSHVFRYVFDLLDYHNLEAIDAFMERYGAKPVFGHECKRPRYRVVEQLFEEIDLNKASTTAMVALLSAAFTARYELENYYVFLGRVRGRLYATETPKRVRDLLSGFER